MAFATKAVANYILELGKREGIEISPMKLQKLVYYAHGWYLAITGERLIDEQIEAWPYGPVVSSLFHDLKKYGNGPVTGPIDELLDLDTSGDFRNWSFAVVIPSLDQCIESEQLRLAKAIIEKSWDEYGTLSAVKLSNMTHEPGAPWHQVMEKYGGDPPKHTDIPESVIREHFEESLNRHLQELA